MRAAERRYYGRKEWLKAHRPRGPAQKRADEGIGRKAQIQKFIPQNIFRANATPAGFKVCNRGGIRNVRPLRGRRNTCMPDATNLGPLRGRI